MISNHFNSRQYTYIDPRAEIIHISVHLFAKIFVFIVNILLASVRLLPPLSSEPLEPGGLLQAPGCLLANSGPNSRFGLRLVPRRKNPRFLALVVLAKALLFDIEVFLTCPGTGVEEGAGGCQPVMVYPLVLVAFDDPRTGISSDCWAGGNNDPAALAAAALRKAMMCGGSLSLKDDTELGV